MREAWLALATCACGRLNFDPDRGDAAVPPDDTFAGLGGFDDNFDDGVKSPFWFTYDDLPSGTRFREDAGRLTIELGSNVADSYAGYITMTTGALRDTAVMIEVVDSPATAGNAGCYFTLATESGGNEISLAVNSGELLATVDTVTRVSTTFDPVEHRWWRIRERDDVVYWEVGRDGILFVEVAQLPTPAFVDGLQVNLGGGTQAAIAMPGSCSFDNFNLPP